MSHRMDDVYTRGTGGGEKVNGAAREKTHHKDSWMKKLEMVEEKELISTLTQKIRGAKNTAKRGPAGVLAGLK